MSQVALERRRFDRFAVQPMYTEVRVQRIHEGKMTELSGHAYDISEGGMRIELDDRLDAGERVNVTLRLPAVHGGEIINAACQVVWANDEEDDPAMPRMALRILSYFDADSHRRLTRYLGSGAVHRVA